MSANRANRWGWRGRRSDGNTTPQDASRQETADANQALKKGGSKDAADRKRASKAFRSREDNANPRREEAASEPAGAPPPDPVSGAQIGSPRPAMQRKKSSWLPYLSYIAMFIVVALLSGLIVLLIL